MARESRVEVAILAPRAEDGRFRRSARVHSPRLGTGELWYEVDEGHAALTTDRGDPFLLATLLLAMSEGHDLILTGAPVDARLLRNLGEFQRIWNAWYGFSIVGIHADPSEETSRGGVAAVAFSGGVDSAFSAWWHTRGDGGNDPPLRTAMMLHGIDIPLADASGFAGAAARARRMVDSLGLELVVVATNAWELPVPVREYTGVGVAAALHVLGGSHTAGLLPSTATYRDLVVPLNSSPVSDWLLGGSAFAIVHDGARYNRLEKLRFLSAWPEAMDSLRVCLQDPRHDRNCGTCNKCMITLAAARLIGTEPACFDRIPSAAAIRRWARRLPSAEYYLQEGGFLVDAAVEAGLHEPWVSTLRNRIRVARVKQAVRAAFPRFADRVAGAHRRVHALRRSAASRISRG